MRADTTNDDLATLMADTDAKLDKIIEDLKASTENLRKANDNIERILNDVIWEK